MAEPTDLPTDADRAPILAAIPHRPPFLYVDRIVSQEDASIRTQYRVRDDEPFIAGHYPGNPIMPGVLICEAILQAGALLAARLQPQAAGDEPRVPVLSRLHDARFRRAVRPGELLEIEVELIERVANAMQMRGSAHVAGKLAVRVTFTSAEVAADRLSSS